MSDVAQSPTSAHTDVFAAAQRVGDAVLWEGYVLYPYRASAAKNQVRWQYGVLVPHDYSVAEKFERWSLQTECIVEFGLQASATIRLRLLQVQSRTIERREADGSFTRVPELEVANAEGTSDLWASWDEAVVHEFDLDPFDLARPGGYEMPIELPASHEVEELGDTGRVVRECWAVKGMARLASEHSPGPYPLTKLRVTVENTTDWCDTTVPRDQAMRHAFVGVHTLLHVDDGSFLSVLDPPEFAKPAVADCVNEGTFPVLIGEPSDPTVMLSSPIILYDHPAVALDSPGDMFDLTEIDEILALRILTLTDEEKRLARSTDPRAAAIIDRIEAFSPETYDSLHGEMVPIIRTPGSADDPAANAAPWWDPAVDASVNPWEDSIIIDGVTVAKGSRVRLRPGEASGRRTDAQDIFLVGMEATVEGVFFDVDDEQHVAVVIDDGAADLRAAQGRFLFFHPDEVEPIT